MAPKKTDKTDQERQLDQLRCRVCGKFHPLIQVCPYIASTKVEQLRDTRNPSMRGRITTTIYFERKELMDTAVESLEEAQKILDDPPNPEHAV